MEGEEDLSPEEGCLTWVNSQLTALVTDAKLLHCVVMVMHAGPAFSRSNGTECVCVCMFLCSLQVTLLI